MPPARPRQRLARADDVVRASGADNGQEGGWSSATAMSSIGGTNGPLWTCAAWSLERSLWCFLGLCASARARRVGDYESTNQICCVLLPRKCAVLLVIH